MNITRHPENSVSWIDLGTPDMETTTAFYNALFGWTVAPPDPNGYRLCTLRGRLVAALGPAEDPGAPYWTINVTVSDIQATTARLTSLGAQIIVAPARVGMLGHAAVALDPVGAPLSLWQPGTHHGMQLTHEPGTFSRHQPSHRPPRACLRLLPTSPALELQPRAHRVPVAGRLHRRHRPAARQANGAAITVAGQFRQQQPRCRRQAGPTARCDRSPSGPQRRHGLARSHRRSVRPDPAHPIAPTPSERVAPGNRAPSCYSTIGVLRGKVPEEAWNGRWRRRPAAGP